MIWAITDDVNEKEVSKCKRSVLSNLIFFMFSFLYIQLTIYRMMGMSDELVLQITKPGKLYNNIRDLQQYCSTADNIDHQNSTFPKNSQPEKNKQYNTLFAIAQKT